MKKSTTGTLQVTKVTKQELANILEIVNDCGAVIEGAESGEVMLHLPLPNRLEDERPDIEYLCNIVGEDLADDDEEVDLPLVWLLDAGERMKCAIVHHTSQRDCCFCGSLGSTWQVVKTGVATALMEDEFPDVVRALDILSDGNRVG